MMNKDLKERVITSVNGGVLPTDVENYLDDYAKDPNDPQARQALVNLAITLKHCANPLGGYSQQLSDNELSYFVHTRATLEDPSKVLPQHPFNDDEILEIQQLLRIKLNALADELIAKYTLQDEINTRLIEIQQEDNQEDAAQAWWNSKTDEEKREIIAYRNNLDETQKRKVVIYIKTYQYQTYGRLDAFDDFLFYYYMCNNAAQLNYYTFVGIEKLIGLTIDVGSSLFNGIVSTFDSVGRMGGGGGFSGGGGGDCDGRAALVIAAILFFTSAAIGAVTAGSYAIKKTVNTVEDITVGYKIPRSLFRLAATGAGAYSGYLAGAAIGAILGSAIPGLGTAVGALIGGILVAFTGAGVAAALSKYLAKMISSFFYSKEFNPTNPDKWRLTSQQEKNLVKNGYDLSVIDDMVRAIKKQKEQLPAAGFFEAIGWERNSVRKKKDELNKLLHQVKMGTVPVLQIGGQVFDANLSRFTANKPGQSTTARLKKYNMVGDAEQKPGGCEPSAPPLLQVDYSVRSPHFKPSAPPLEFRRSLPLPGIVSPELVAVRSHRSSGTR